MSALRSQLAHVSRAGIDSACSHRMSRVQSVLQRQRAELRVTKLARRDLAPDHGYPGAAREGRRRAILRFASLVPSCHIPAMGDFELHVSVPDGDFERARSATMSRLSVAKEWPHNGALALSRDAVGIWFNACARLYLEGGDDRAPLRPVQL